MSMAWGENGDVQVCQDKQREESARHQEERDQLNEEAATRYRARMAKAEAARVQAEKTA